MPLALIIASLFVSIGAIDIAAKSVVPAPTEERSIEVAQGEILPKTLRIPALGVSASVEHAGLTRAGAMEAPEKLENAAWYALGPRPGSAKGSAVFAGHLDNGLGLPGIFARLNELKKGDRIYVRDRHGFEQTYEVARVRSYPTDTAPREEIFHTNGESELVLITCDGKWVASEKTYDHRLVVFARPL